MLLSKNAQLLRLTARLLCKSFYTIPLSLTTIITTTTYVLLLLLQLLEPREGTCGEGNKAAALEARTNATTAIKALLVLQL